MTLLLYFSRIWGGGGVFPMMLVAEITNTIFEIPQFPDILFYYPYSGFVCIWLLFFVIAFRGTCICMFTGPLSDYSSVLRSVMTIVSMTRSIAACLNDLCGFFWGIFQRWNLHQCPYYFLEMHRPL